MTPEILGLVFMGALLTGIFAGFPICFTLIILSVVFGYIGIGPQVFYLMVFQTVGMMKEEVLAAVHAPIGLDINAETPEEIALSIMAEIVMVRRGGKGGLMRLGEG